MTRTLVLLAALLLAAPAGAATDRRAIAAVPDSGGAPVIVAIARTQEICLRMVERLNIGAAAPPADDFRFACVAVPAEV